MYLGVKFIIKRWVDEHTKLILRFLYIQRFYNLDNIFLFDGRFLRFVEDGNEINIGTIFRFFHQIGNNPKPTTFTCTFRSISYTYFVDVSTIAVPHPRVFKQIAFQGSKAFAKCLVFFQQPFCFFVNRGGYVYFIVLHVLGQPWCRSVFFPPVFASPRLSLVPFPSLVLTS